MNDDELAVKLFTRNMHAGAFPLLMAYHNKKQAGPVSKELVEEAKNAAITAKILNEYCSNLLNKLSEAHKLNLPK